MSASLSSPADTAISAARCAHFGACGGCSIQNQPYEEQLRLKAARVEAALAALSDLPRLTIHPSPDIWNYRNKMEFSFGDVYPPVINGPTVKLGLKPKGRWNQVLDLSQCHLLSQEAPQLLASVRAWAEREKITPYNSHKHTGLLRHLVVREAKNGPDRLVLLVTAPGELPAASFIEAVQAAYPATSILRGVNGKVSDTAVSDALQILTGSGVIVETVRLPGRDLKFQISPHSFFQTNTRGAELLYGLIADWVAGEKAELVLDLYCGGGGITLALAGICRKVVGVELNAAAVVDARANAQRNGIINAEFYCGATETLAAALLDAVPDLVVVDPPRAGLHAQATKALLEAACPRILYVSCNPESLGRDLAGLSSGYVVDRIAVVDLFPHTDHVETVALLRST